MPVVKNKSTAENREFWSHVESIAHAVRSRNGRSDPGRSGVCHSREDLDENRAGEERHPSANHQQPE